VCRARGRRARIWLALASPVIAIALLGVLAAVQFAVGSALLSCRRGDAQEAVLVRWWSVYSAGWHPHCAAASSESGRSSAAAVPLSIRRIPRAERAAAEGARRVTGSTAARTERAAEKERTKSPDSPRLVEADDSWTTRSTANSLWLLYLRTLMRVLQLSYTGVTVLALSFYRLQDVGQFGQRVVDYPALSPSSAVYRSCSR